MKKLLLPIALLYHIILKIRHKLYDWHFLTSLRIEKPIIGVGNLNLGGTGKTPTVEYLAKLLKAHYSVAILSRGYGRKGKGFKLADSQCTYKDLGDEPMQYFMKFPDIQVAVDADRLEGARKLFLSKNAPDVILLDDAFQHRRIRAGLEILLTDYQRLYVDDHLFPAGTLRDLKSAAHRAHIIVVSKSPARLSEAEKQQIIRELKPEAHQKVFFSYLEYQKPKPLNSIAQNYSFEEADSALVFSGIANGKPFVEEMEKHFSKVISLSFGDHHAYSQTDIQAILKRYAELDDERKIIVTTEKDAARLAKSPYLCQFEKTPLYALPIGVRFHNEDKLNEEILNYVRQDSHHN